jgi:hypothetical protein
MNLTTIFYHSDEFCKFFEKEFPIRVLSDGKNIRKRDGSLKLSEIMTIVIYYQQSGYKTFKDYYTRNDELKSAFPGLTSYNRFVELQQKITMPLAIFTKLYALGKCDGNSYIDSFSLSVSHQKRISSHKTFKGLAARGKTSVGWFYGFKVHVIINGWGEIIDFCITSGNVVDNNTKVIEKITEKIYGKVYGDKGYLLNPELFQKLYSKGIHIVTKIRNNMKNKLMDIGDKIMLKKRGIIESVGAILKEDLNIEHSRYRSPRSLIINVFAALAAYGFRKKKPSIYKKSFFLLTA